MRRSFREWPTLSRRLVVLLLGFTPCFVGAGEHGGGVVHGAHGGGVVHGAHGGGVVHGGHEGHPALHHDYCGPSPTGYGFGFLYAGYTPPNFFLFGPSPAYFSPVMPRPIVVLPNGGGLMLPQPGPPVAAPAQIRPPQIRPEPAKSDGFVTIGDRLFRAGNYKRAEERYQHALRANPNSATPRVRLAQLALVRGNYREAAEQIRAATVAEPGWYVNATDIQALYAEPADFAQVIAKLEAHLQRTPGDRDAWLALGAELFLSGKTRQAGDIFTRLNDRKPDQTLAAFIDATTPD
jgi:hypothetical protein